MPWSYQQPCQVVEVAAEVSGDTRITCNLKTKNNKYDGTAGIYTIYTSDPSVVAWFPVGALLTITISSP